MLRAYGEPLPKRGSSRRQELKPSGWELIFDTETTVDAAQVLRFGVYQLRKDGMLKERGIFYHPHQQYEDDFEILRAYADKHGLDFLSLEDFVRDRFLNIGFETGGTIVGFNLPFDISRLAIDCSRARKVVRKTKNGRVVDRRMVGGFTFKLVQDDNYPHVRIRHLSRRAAFIDFAIPKEEATADLEDNTRTARIAERGSFLDVKTLAAALTSQSHSLKSLAKELNVARKCEFGNFEDPLTAKFIDYAMQDVEVTWQCYVALKSKYESHVLSLTQANQIYSEAGIGKAYLRQMGIKPWREVQPDFDPATIGAIMSSYFGGRAEVHIRRQTVRTIYCDFASMYPTVCTLMRLWRFVIANGINVEDATNEVKTLLNGIDLPQLENPLVWTNLHVLVKVKTEADIFPVRARYSEEPIPTIGLNYLSSDCELWFTLADCIASKLLTGVVPNVVEAIRFTPQAVQDGLQPITVAGNPDFLVDPNVTNSTNDFYKRVIDRRREVKAALKLAKLEQDEDRIRTLKGEELSLKILANATSYGIFIELNVEGLDEEDGPFTVHTGQGSFMAKPGKMEQPGSYFHPLLATLTTGAARLMMAMTERLVYDERLDWAFCDTDGIAIAMRNGDDALDFEGRHRKNPQAFRRLKSLRRKGFDS